MNERTIYLLTETEYASAGNFPSVIGAYFTHEEAENYKNKYEKQHREYKEKHPNIDLCVEYDISDIILFE